MVTSATEASSPPFACGVETPASAHLVRSFGAFPPDYCELDAPSLLSFPPSPLVCFALSSSPRRLQLESRPFVLESGSCSGVFCVGSCMAKWS